MNQKSRVLYRTVALAVLGLLPFLPSVAHAQKPANLPGGFPAKPVRVLIGLAAGGGVDILVRAMGQKLSEKWETAIVIENRPTAGGVAVMDMLGAGNARWLHLAGLG